MDSTPTPIQHKPSASKLPIKRKTPDPLLLEPDPKSPPFKFHRIWTEPDEIRFLQGLLDCSSENLCFPRDLGIFYSRFSNTMSQPYTKSQLSEKLRRLRKKFRIISTRLSKGMDQSQLSLHDRALYDLSKRLWHPDCAATSPFNGARNVGVVSSNNCGVGEGERSGLVGIKVDFSPTLPVTALGFDDHNHDHDHDGGGINLELDNVDDEVKIDGDGVEGEIAFGGEDRGKNDGEFKLSEVNVEFEGEEKGICRVEVGEAVAVAEDKIGQAAGKAVVDVFEECLKEARMRIQGQGCCDGERSNFGLRWHQQRVAELDALGNRLRLVIEHSLRKQ